MTGKDQEAFAALVRAALFYFIRRVFLTVVPGVPFLANWHIEAIAYQLERCARGDQKRLIVTVPPRH